MDPFLKRVIYALACIAVPALWGIAVVWASNAVERRVRHRHDREIPPIEFHI